MNPAAPLKVAVLDMQPIEPATGGGRLRLLGLYHALGADVRTHYVGTYDWRGPGYRRQMLSPSLEEELIPLSEAHFAAAETRSRAAGGRVVIDSTFAQLAHLSPDFVDGARRVASEADVVIFSHPWVFPLVQGVLDRTRQLVVYDAHNVEGLLRMELLDDGGAGTGIVRDVIRVERELCQDADLIVACSHADRAAFNRLYGIPFARMRVVANGTFTDKITRATRDQKTAARAALKLSSAPAVFFIGSNYAPNVQAARFIADYLCPALPNILFVVAGGVGAALAGTALPFNLRVTGDLSENQKSQWLQAADVAINPMFGGSGTNIKMLDYMAAGLCIVTTNVGARGLDLHISTVYQAEAGEFVARLSEVVDDSVSATASTAEARRNVLEHYSWEALSPRLGTVLRSHFRTLRRRPFFSIVIPRNGDELARRALEGLSRQSFQNFEVILAGGKCDLIDTENDREFAMVAIDAPFADGDSARNLGADISSGAVIAFLEPDQIPDRFWLDNAYAEFANQRIAVLQGSASFDNTETPQGGNWRTNTFFRSEVFHALGGYSRRFTGEDLAWHAQRYGTVTGSRDVRVRNGKGAEDIPATVFPQPERIGWISTWNVPCGIAEYSRNLLTGLERRRDGATSAIIFCDTRTPPGSSTGRVIVPCWSIGTSDIRHLSRTILREPLRKLVVQHQSGLLPWPSLWKLLNDEQLRHLEISLVLHNTQELAAMGAAGQLAAKTALRRARHVFVHAVSDYDRLMKLGLGDSLKLLPHGVSEVRIAERARRLDPSAAPVIGCFGFFFPHKRVHALIEAFAEIRKDWPKARLRLVNAAFPRDDSRNEIARCRELATKLRVMDAIEWKTGFVEEVEAIRLLSECDLIVLPYASTIESASGAIRIALASGAPVAATAVEIFDEAESAVATLDNPDPSGLADSIREILRDRELRLRLQSAGAGWTQIRTWIRMADRLLSAIAVDAENDGRGADAAGQSPRSAGTNTIAPGANLVQPRYPASGNRDGNREKHAPID